MSVLPRLMQLPPTRLNRSVLGLLGLVLLGVAAFEMLFACTPLSRGIPALSPHAPILPPGFTAPWWLAPLFLALSVLVAACSLRWLAGQAPRTGPHPVWRLSGPDLSAGPLEPGHVLLDTGYAADAIAADVRAHPAVTRAVAVITGAPHQADLLLTVHARDTAEIAELQRYLAHEALPRLRQALDCPQLSTRLLLHIDSGARSTPVS